MRHKSGGDEEEHPRKGHSGEADSTQKAPGHLGVHGGQGHTGQADRNKAFSVGPVGVLLQEVQEAVDQADGAGQQDEQEHEANSANAFLQTAAEKQQSCDAEEQLDGGPVGEGIQQECVEMPPEKHTPTHTEDAWGEVQTLLDHKQNA